MDLQKEEHIRAQTADIISSGKSECDNSWPVKAVPLIILVSI